MDRTQLCGSCDAGSIPAEITNKKKAPLFGAFLSYILKENPINWLNVVTIAVLCVLLFKIKIPSPYWVVAAILLGIIV